MLTRLSAVRCTNPLATDKTVRSYASTCHRCARSWQQGYWQGYLRRVATASRASGGSVLRSGSLWARGYEDPSIAQDIEEPVGQKLDEARCHARRMLNSSGVTCGE